jgi:hypothetical protein
MANQTRTYGDLNLRAIREATGLDFAHYTYQPNMCSCCYGPEDFPKRYWNKDSITIDQEGKIHAKDENYSYILFKNASNGSGSVTKNDTIIPSEIAGDDVYISYSFRDDAQRDAVIAALQEQLGDLYIVTTPEDENHCIRIIGHDRY